MSKTPISILNELTVRINIVPQYELLTSDGTNTHKPTFYYRLTAGKVIAYGKARTKIDAKHEAARSALEMLAELGFYHPSHPTPSSSPVHMQVNAISTLHEMCAKNIFPPPEFILIAVLGPAHFRQFTVECKIANMIVSATDITKKKAKQLSAQKMLDQLMDTLPEVLAELKSRDSLCSVPAILLPEDDLAACSESTQLVQIQICPQRSGNTHCKTRKP